MSSTNSAMVNGRPSALDTQRADVVEADATESADEMEDVATDEGETSIGSDAGCNADEAADDESPDSDGSTVTASRPKWYNRFRRTGDNKRESVAGARRRRPIVIGIGTVALASVLAGIGVGGWQLYQEHRRDTAAHQAREAAEKYAMVLTSIDTNNLDKNFADVLAGSTGQFRDMYAKSSTQLRQLLVDNKAAAHGTVVESAVQSATADKVVILLFVDQSITNTAVPDPRIDRSRIKMTMDKVDGRWLAEKVELP